MSWPGSLRQGSPRAQGPLCPQCYPEGEHTEADPPQKVGGAGKRAVPSPETRRPEAVRSDGGFVSTGRGGLSSGPPQEDPCRGHSRAAEVL